MRRQHGRLCTAITCVSLALVLAEGCQQKEKIDMAAAAPPKTEVVDEPDLNVVKVDRPERFALVSASPKQDVPQIRTTGTIMPDVEKSIPVISLASGRVVGISARLGDDVKKGQLLLKVVSNDVANAFQSYQQAEADEQLASKQLERAKLLYDRGAISLNDLQVTEEAQQKAAIAMATSAQQIRTLGGDPEHADSVVNIYAPASGTIVEQNAVLAASVRTPDNQQNLFTIADLSRVWVLCDVFENDLPIVRPGDTADVELNAYPGKVFHGRISNISKVLDPATRSAKVRIQLNNPGLMRQGMFVTATFFGQRGRTYCSVPSSAVLHLHDRDWVFVPAENGQFRRTEIRAGKIEGGRQEVLAGITPGQQVVSEALALNAESEQ